MTDKRSNFELITGLRAKYRLVESMGDRPSASRMLEAADRIEELAAENERLLSALRSVDEADRSSPKGPDADKHKRQQLRGAMRKVRQALKGQGE